MFAALFACFAGTWFVDVNAAPPGNGTQISPYTSIQYALDQATTIDGDTLLVAPGTYVESVTITKRVEVRSTGGPPATQLRPTAAAAVTSRVSFGGPGPVIVPTLVGFTVDGSLSAMPGVGVFWISSHLKVEHCVVTGFSQSEAVFQTEHSFLHLNQCTIAGNWIGLSAFPTPGAGITARGCIVRDNSLDDVQALAGGITFTTSCVPASFVSWGTGNFSTSPGFWDAPLRDYHLKPLSPCIDTGSAVHLPPDPDGSPPDVGAFAYDPLHAPFPASYCTPKTNSAGCAVSISSSGAASLSGPDDFFLTATSALNQKPGLFIWSRAPKATPFAGATLCLDGPIVRGPALASGGSPTGSDCTGVFQWHFSQAYMASKSITAGSILYAQAWGRDNGFAPPDNAQLSDARVFPVGP